MRAGQEGMGCQESGETREQEVDKALRVPRDPRGAQACLDQWARKDLL